MDNDLWLKYIINDPIKLKKLATNHRKLYNYISVKKSEVNQYTADNWIKDKDLKFKTRLKKPRKFDDVWESKSWLLFYPLERLKEREE